MKKNDELPNAFTSATPWHKATNMIWPTTSMLLRRNLDSFPFPSKINVKNAKEVQNLITESLSSYKAFPANVLTPHQKELLFEHFILHEGFEKNDEGRCFIVDNSAKFLGIINLEDHLHIHTFSFDSDFKESWKSLSKLEETLSKKLQFAYSPQFGYLTSNPSLCGTAFVVQAVLHLPMLLHLDEFSFLLDRLPKELQVKGLGEEGEYLGDMVLLENKYTLGVSEESILKSVKETAEKFSNEEANLRLHIKDDQIPLLKDKIGRSFGLISNACSLKAEEALSSLSLIHLGKELGFLQDQGSFNFFDLFFTCRRAHLSELNKTGTLSNELLATARADHLRKEIATLTPSNLFT